MQIMPATAREYKVRNPFDPKANIEAGVKHLKALLDRFGGDRTELALAAYNAGAGAVEKFNGIPPYRETRNYVTRILELAGLK
jgi:soluble lytic murein transglycosylase-like protein